MIAPRAIHMIHFVTLDVGVIEKFGVTLTWAWADAGARTRIAVEAATSQPANLIERRKRTGRDSISSPFSTRADPNGGVLEGRHTRGGRGSV